MINYPERDINAMRFVLGHLDYDLAAAKEEVDLMRRPDGALGKFFDAIKEMDHYEPHPWRAFRQYIIDIEPVYAGEYCNWAGQLASEYAYQMQQLTPYGLNVEVYDTLKVLCGTFFADYQSAMDGFKKLPPVPKPVSEMVAAILSLPRPPKKWTTLTRHFVSVFGAFWCKRMSIFTLLHDTYRKEQAANSGEMWHAVFNDDEGSVLLSDAVERRRHPIDYWRKRPDHNNPEALHHLVEINRPPDSNHSVMRTNPETGEEEPFWVSACRKLDEAFGRKRKWEPMPFKANAYLIGRNQDPSAAHD